MGSDRLDDQKPPHRVNVSPFAIGKHEVTQAQWTAVIGSNPSSNQGDNLPVEKVSWDDVQDFLKKVGNRFRLPTEAEWEYAARARTNTAYSFGDSEAQLGEYAWLSGNAGCKTHPVGEKKPNPFGLFDMHGNVWDWCSDWYLWRMRGGAFYPWIQVINLLHQKHVHATEIRSKKKNFRTKLHRSGRKSPGVKAWVRFS